MGYEHRIKKREQMAKERVSLGEALSSLQKLYERIRMTETNWFKMNQDEQRQLIEEISSLATELMKGEYGELTELLHRIGSTIFKAATPKDGWGTRHILYWWSDESRKFLEGNCTLGKRRVEVRLRELSHELTKQHPTPADSSKILERLFESHYSNLGIDISETDLDKLKTYNDQDIRDRLARILMESDIVPADQKAKLEELSTRPHTAHEIADFEIIVKIDEGTYQVDFVIKSGAEITRPINEEDVWYQISRPLDNESDLVVFVSYANLTIPLKNKIRKHRDKVEYIIQMELAALFKSYEELD